jgi:hypothetical protein
MDSLAGLPHPTVALILSRHFNECHDKPRQKALKKAFHTLKTRGVSGAELSLPREEVRIIKPLATGRLEGKISWIDGRGKRMVVIQVPREVLNFNVLAALCDELNGLDECHVLSLNKKGIREMLEHIDPGGMGYLTPADPAYCLSLLEEAFSLNPDQNKEAPAAYAQVRNNLLRRKELAELPEITDMLPQFQAGEEVWYLGRYGELLEEEILQTWYLPPDQLAPWVEKIQEVESSRLILDRAQQQQRFEAITAQAAGEFFSPGQRQLLSRRLLAMAYYFDCRGNSEKGRLAQAVGEDLARERGILQGENPFLLELIEVSIDAITGQKEEVQAAQKEAESSSPIILSPY